MAQHQFCNYALYASSDSDFSNADFLQSETDFDVVLRNGLVCDGTGSPCRSWGVAIKGDKIAKTGNVSGDRGRIDIDVDGQAIAPGFINMMSSHEGLFADGRGLSDLLQGVTLEIFGEGESLGPLTDGMRAEMASQQFDIKYDVTWHSLKEGLEVLVARGISPNIASFIGAATPRIFVLGRANYNVSTLVFGQQSPSTPPTVPCNNRTNPACVDFSFGNAVSQSNALLYGASIGGGIDVAVAQNVFARAEVEYIQFAPINHILSSITSARVGAGIKF